jgi:thiamine pyrophosphokinase
MTDGNVQSSQGVTLVGAGRSRGEIIRDLLARAPDLVAADGGARACKALGLAPVAVIGDFDSLGDATQYDWPDTRFLHVAEQDSTDFDKSLTRIEAPAILATGFTGGRVDHTLASMSSLVRHEGPPVILVDEQDIIFAAPELLALELPADSRLSLFPMARVTGRSDGLRWPIDGLVLEPGGRIGTSNEVTGPVELGFSARGCLVILPREALDAALAALTDHRGARGR